MRKILCVLLGACLFAALLPGVSGEARAAELRAGDSIYFGSYFKTYVTDADSAGETGRTAPEADYTDTGIVNYRGSLAVAAVDEVRYAKVTSWDGEAFYRAEPIEWRVLSVTGSKALLISELALESMTFHASGNQATWAESTLRSWLNSYGRTSNSAGKGYTSHGFLTLAFSEGERAAIKTTDLETEGSEDTQDKIFLLSMEEVLQYLPGDSDRAVLKESDYLEALGWFLRSPRGEGMVDFVASGGELLGRGASVPLSVLGVRPALTLDLRRVNLAASADGTFTATLKNSDEVNPGPFYDVTPKDWFYRAVELAYEHGLIQGTGVEKFSPDGTVTLAQAITIACRIHRDYHGYADSFEGDGEWYRPYVGYAVKYGLIEADEFADYEAPATRGEVARLFARSLPETSFAAVNSTERVLDVDGNTPYAREILLLVGAGVIAGSREGSAVRPGDRITRAELAAIAVRVVLKEERLTYSS